MFRFEEPAYLYLLLLLPLLAAFYLYSNYRRRKNIRKFGDPELMAQLMPDVSKYRPDVKFWMVFVAIGLFSVLLARPQFGSKLETVKRQGVEVMIALDISNSMLAQDVQPSRLQKAKRLVAQLVDKMENDKVGMIVFAGDAFTQLPITSDYISAKMFLESIDPSLISKQGTAIGAAINLASRSFTPQEGVGRAVIVITDGENHEGGAVEAAKDAAEKGIQVNVLGVGMPEGAPIPAEGTNDYRRDRDGNVIVTRLNEQMCQEIAKAGNGIYVRVDNTMVLKRRLAGKLIKWRKLMWKHRYTQSLMSSSRLWHGLFCCFYWQKCWYWNARILCSVIFICFPIRNDAYVTEKIYKLFFIAANGSYSFGSESRT